MVLTDDSLKTQFDFDDRNHAFYFGFMLQYDLGIADFQLWNNCAVLVTVT